jgi:hypothetical protein
MRVVFDTNLYISFLLSKGNSSILQILEAWQKGQFVVLLSPEILKEVARVLTSEKIEKLTKLDHKEIKQFLKNISQRAIIFEPHVDFKIIQQDPTDDKFLNLAIDGSAKYIVSGDQHLLKLKKFKKVYILNPQQFLNNIKKKEKN